MNFLRVKKSNPCPVCGKPDWCLISPDGKVVICARIESDKPAGDKGAGWLHNLENPVPAPAVIPPAVKQSVKASPDVLDSVYKALLSVLELSQAHRENLRSRGLSDTEIKALGYKTLPAYDRLRLTAQLVYKGFKLSGVPGFYVNRSFCWSLAGPAGLLIPVRDTNRRIQGFQIRRDRATENKYVWLSSANYTGGCSPGAPVHFASPALYYQSATELMQPDIPIWITEGPLKADIAALKLGCLVLAVAGVANWASVLPMLMEIAPSRVIIAFDMDKNTTDPKKRFIRYFLYELTAALLRRGIRTFEADWDPNMKGIDDLCPKSR